MSDGPPEVFVYDADSSRVYIVEPDALDTLTHSAYTGSGRVEMSNSLPVDEDGLPIPDATPQMVPPSERAAPVLARAKSMRGPRPYRPEAWEVEEANLRAEVDTLRAALEACQQERDEAMDVLNPNVRESGLVDACRQVKQVAISEADNAQSAEASLADMVRALRELEAEWRRLEGAEEGCAEDLAALLKAQALT
jgi:hypothetical protein